LSIINQKSIKIKKKLDYICHNLYNYFSNIFSKYEH